jgi:hypothetical protein
MEDGSDRSTFYRGSAETTEPQIYLHQISDILGMNQQIMSAGNSRHQGLLIFLIFTGNVVVWGCGVLPG